jgi:hypothetical protein
VQIASICSRLPDQFERREPLSPDEFTAMVTAMCGRYATLRQAIEQMADEEIRELRRMVKARCK